MEILVKETKIKRVSHHNSINDCWILTGIKEDNSEVTLYIAEECDVDHEMIGTPKKVLFDSLKRKSGSSMNLEISQIATKVVDIKGVRTELDYKITRIIK